MATHDYEKVCKARGCAWWDYGHCLHFDYCEKDADKRRTDE